MNAILGRFRWAVAALLGPTLIACGAASSGPAPGDSSSQSPDGPTSSGAQPTAQRSSGPVSVLAQGLFFTPYRSSDDAVLTLDGTSPASAHLGAAPASAEWALALIRATPDAQGGVSVTVGNLRSGASAEAAELAGLVPLSSHGVTVRASAPATAKVAVLGHFDHSGGGWVATSEPQRVLTGERLAAGARRPLTLPPSPVKATATLLALTVRTAGDAAGLGGVQLELYGCDPERGSQEPVAPGALQWEVSSDPRTVVVPASLHLGAVCLSSSHDVELSVVQLGAFVRYGGAALYPTDLLTLLDTRTGAGGWQGALDDGQTVELDLSGLRELPAGVTTAWAQVQASAGVRVGDCSADGAWELSLSDESPLASVPLPLAGRRWCFTATQGATHLNVQLAGVFAPEPAGEVACPARSTLPLEGCVAAASDVLGRLKCLPGVRVEPVSRQHSSVPGAKVFVLYLKQPANHADPRSPTFEQRMVLTHVDFDAPMVMVTTGYDVRAYESELARTFRANELQIEHRFFGESIPARADWRDLDVEQSARDSHRIVEILRRVYPKRWVNTGHSKGGMTALFHRRYFPCDVDATVPYVTPLAFSPADPRFAAFLKGIGGTRWQSCREAFHAVGEAALRREAEWLPLMRGSYTQIGSKGAALRLAAAGFDWGFWQYTLPGDARRGCPAVEQAVSTPGQLASMAQQVAGQAQGYADESLRESWTSSFAAYLVQALHELGEKSYYADHLSQFGPTEDPARSLALSVMPERRRAHEPEAMQDISAWVQARGSKLMFVYGETDPWSGAAVELGPSPKDAFRYFAPSNHGAMLADLPTPQRRAAYEALSRWLETQPVGVPLSLGPVEAPVRYFRDVMRELPGAAWVPTVRAPSEQQASSTRGLDGDASW